MAEGQEEQFVLRVVDTQLAERLRAALREEPNASLEEQGIQLAFPENGRRGKLTVAGTDYPVHVLDLPTTVESYKTYDDVNLVKTGDVGQVLMVGAVPEPQAREIRAAEAGGKPSAPVESLDGITPPMREARARHLRPRLDVPPEIVAKVEDAIIDILDGYAPAGMQFEDHEEEYVVDPATGRGRWQPVSKATAAKEKAAAKEKERAAELAEMLD